MKILVATFVGLTLAASSLYAADTIINRDGSKIQAKVVKADSSKITYMVAGQPQTRSLDKIEVIEFEKKPTPFIQGEKAFNNYRYAEAAKFFLKAAKLPSKPFFWAKDYGMYNAARAYYFAEDFDNASATYQKLIDSSSSSRWLAEAQLGLVDCAIKKGDLAAAKKLVKKYQGSKSAKMDYYKRLGEFSSAKVLMAAEDYKKASRAFSTLAIKSKKEYPTLYSRAQLGMAQALIFAKDFSKAKAKLGEFLDKASDAVKPEALNALGDCYFQEAQTKKGKDRDALVEAARWQYLRVFVLYSYSPEAIKAKYYAAQCFTALAAKEETAKARAKALNKEILKSAPKSEWAAKIKKAK